MYREKTKAGLTLMSLAFKILGQQVRCKGYSVGSWPSFYLASISSREQVLYVNSHILQICLISLDFPSVLISFWESALPNFSSSLYKINSNIIHSYYNNNLIYAHFLLINDEYVSKHMLQTCNCLSIC